MKYKIALRRSKEGYSVWVPGLPGCCSQGATKKEAMELYRKGTKALLKAHERNRSKETDKAKIDKLDVEVIQKLQALGSIFTKRVRVRRDKKGKLRLTF